MSLSQLTCREVAHQVPSSRPQFLVLFQQFAYQFLQIDVLPFQEQDPLFQIDGVDWRTICRLQTIPILRASHAVMVVTRFHGSLLTSSGEASLPVGVFIQVPAQGMEDAQPIQAELRITLQKFPRLNLGFLSASTSALTLPKAVSGFLWMPS
jgi:hypothetical protein